MRGVKQCEEGSSATLHCQPVMRSGRRPISNRIHRGCPGMSALNFYLQQDLLAVATDTLALAGDTHLPSHFQAKMFPVLHLNGVICGTGISQLIVQWYVTAATAMLARSIPHLDQFTPDGLRRLAAATLPPLGSTSTIYHFGYDDDQARFRGFAYRSERNFESEELGYGFGMKPPVEFAPSSNILEDFISLVSVQRESDLARPLQERLGIGGEVHVLLLQPGHIAMTRCHRFADFEALYDDMCTRLLC